MIIYYSPAFTSNAYFDMKANSGIAFDTMICGNADLLRVLMLHLGIHHETLSSVERAAIYRNVFKNQINSHPGCIFEKSFEVGDLSVSSKCLEWRDKLVLAGWDYAKEQPSQRLQFIADVEKEFSKKKEAIGEADMWMEVKKATETTCGLPEGSQVILPNVSKELLPPYIISILDNLANKGIKITEQKITSVLAEGNLGKVQKYLLGGKPEELDPKDNSLEILNFPDEISALQYVASIKPDAYDVYINSDNKTFDDMQLSLKYPTSGSQLNNANPQIVQSFKIALSLFDYPMNITNILSWLLIPYNPIENNLRMGLARVISSTGGIYNEDWNNFINKYKSEPVHNPFEEKDLTDEEKINNIKQLDMYLPRQNSTDVDKEIIKKYVINLQSYFEQKIHANDKEKLFPDIVIEQFGRLSSMFKAFLKLLLDYESETIKYSIVEIWVNSIYEATNYSYTSNLKSSRHIINSPGDIVASPSNIIWLDLYNYNEATSFYDFLNPTEVNQLSYMNFWEGDKEASYYNSMFINPVLLCEKKISLVVVDRKNAEITTKHPLYIRLMQSFDSLNIKELIQSPDIKQLCNGSTRVNKFDNEVINPLDIHIDNSGKIAYRETESFSSLDLLINYPFDYTMKYLASFSDSRSFTLPDMIPTKGSVAHEVIHRMFEDCKMNASAVKDMLIEKYDMYFNDAVEHVGAILFQKENQIDAQLLKVQLKEAIITLVDIITENNLSVEGLEYEITKPLESLPNITGKLDMRLKDGNGRLHVFDFKWSEIKKYNDLLKNNKAMQLELYAALLSKESGNSNIGKSYFILPHHTLLTTNFELKGKDVRIVKVDDTSSLMEKIKNSFAYRKFQISSGTIEMAEGMSLADIEYHNDEAEKNLYPLISHDNKVKSKNSYSKNKLFKGELK